ncbi:Putative Zinc finger, CCCH-type [Septoria linicola]|uniref:Zinc finger, CCCH-type n=1 Tax=Septoria linicola TaxID=215465 RepID=A0A9Q9EPX2_9PEZI|nr:putative Zinc finger, CCCH-type [Septoria linicola]USW59221.1 Putative Zinc finger, CCCH-type [Septoria linicola]
MVICKFFQEGRCRYGDSCRNEHPRSTFQQPQTNRFTPLSNQAGSNGFGARGRSGNVDENPYHLATEDIRNDLTYSRDKKEGERPLYPFGAYGPGKNAPKQLIEGDLEISPEELRVQAYLADATGSIQQFQAQYAQIEALMSAKIQQIMNNTEDAKRYAADTSPPNRNDSVIKPAAGTWKGGQTQTISTGGFGSTSQAASGFGAASRPGFGGSSQPAFGAPSAPGAAAGNAFGAASSAGGFGAPSALGPKASPFGGNTSAAPSTGFGAPSALGARTSPFGGQQAAGGFGAPSAMGPKPSPFAGAQQPAAPAANTTGGFGAPSSTGATASPFAAPQQTASTGFGAPSAMGQTSSPFAGAAQPAAGGFGAASKPAFGTSDFGAGAAQSTGGFGSQQPATQTSTAFGGGQTQTSGTAFGAPSAFGANRPSPFAQPGQPQQSGLSRPNPFAAKPPTGPAAQTGANTGFGSGSSGFGSASGQVQTPQTATFGANNSGSGTQQQQGAPNTFKGKRIVTDEKLNTPGYEVSDPTKPNGIGIERIWFPGGPPEVSEKLNAMTEAPAAVYEDPALGPKLKQIYEWTAQHGTFIKDGAIVMPEIPPKREWCVYEF